MTDFWNDIPTIDELKSEDDVKLRVVIPLLLALGYERRDIRSEYPVTFREGRRGRRPAADFVCFSGSSQDRDTSLLVVEAKAPGKVLKNGKAQGESYANNVSAPLLLLTNGEHLEVWQLQATRESERVLAISVASMAAERGKVERLLGKAAISDYCKQFNIKTILETSGDYSRYETAELQRSAMYEFSISRTLRRKADAEQPLSIKMDRLLVEYQAGAVVLAPSGYGKTTLSRCLFRQAIEGRRRGNPQRLPIDVPLPDLEQTQVSILEFIHQRISPHCPGVTPAFLATTLKDVGATIFCDGFDRTTASFRTKIVTEFTNLIRDYQLVQLFVFSRSAPKWEISPPLLDLEPLSDVQIREFERLVLNGNPSFSITNMMSTSLRTLCTNPLLLRLTLEYWKRERDFPKKIEVLFRSWLEKLLETEPHDYVATVQREKALTLISQATNDSPIEAFKAIAALKRFDIPSTTLDELIGCDAIRASGPSLEIQHEALADYLRAKAVSAMEEDVFLSYLPNLSMPDDSFFPVLLMAQLRTYRLQSALWRRLSKSNLSIYFDALRYRFDVSNELERSSADELSEKYLQELIGGIEEPLIGFFPQLREAVVDNITRSEKKMLAITGRAKTHPGILSYKIHGRDPGEPRVNVAAPTFPGILRAVDLNLARYRIDSARLLGMTFLKEAVFDSVKNLQLKGGSLWAAERLIGRVRYLARKFAADVGVHENFDRLEAFLKPQIGVWVEDGPFFGSERFSIQSLLDDIAALRAADQIALDPWWLRVGWDEGVMIQDEEVIRRVLDEEYRRVQMIYAEIVRTTFPGLLDRIGFFTALPIRWKLTVVKSDQTKNRYAVVFRWLPVESWDEAGADVIFSDDYEPFPGPDETRNALAKLNRPNSIIRRNGGFTPLSSYNGYQWDGGYFDGGTPVTHQVRSLLMAELRDIFDSLPGGDGAF
ncbi:type I restriction enzyme HsdR N-terminal domain-containing protein [Acidisphaera sp. S103]|uniref:type I restriction enzyme HsdR N-terminal domain-containing protein n=1 Tax=Acidisphaera sp. S103 TaxID=1747223 RepID=UPI00131BB742|nr:type I restriction enzyme HsdR N-terminal domain-containing protein [Acidisphaera sp. S103]